MEILSPSHRKVYVWAKTEGQFQKDRIPSQVYEQIAKYNFLNKCQSYIRKC